MKVFLTGATGFVGAHTALALMDAGHDLRLLVRDREFARRYFERLGRALPEVVVADMRDREAVRQAMAGCDAVLHAAAMVSLDPKKADEIYRSNLDSVEAVIGTAHALGIPNIVYVSSLGALFNPGARSIDERSPLGVSREAYSRSKRDCEAYVRSLQRQGAPIQITYPGAIFGPDDPRLNESNHSLLSLLRVVPDTSSGIQCVDVRDLALIHRLLLENPPQGDFEQARYVVGGRFYPWPEFRRLLEGVTGRRIFHPPVPGGLLRLGGWLMDGVKKLYPLDLPVTSESMAIVTQWTEADSRRVLARFGLDFRPGGETFADTIRWLCQAGHLEPALAGKLAHR